MKEIPLTQGHVAIVDDDDYTIAAAFKWTCKARRRKDGSVVVYAHRKVGGRKHSRNVFLHRFLLQVTDSRIDVDHRDGNGLNNCRSNLRTCTRSLNNANKPVASDSASGFKGVTWHKRARKWQVNLKANGQQHYLGLFQSAEEGARAWNAAALKQFGEFAVLNAVA